MNYHPNYHLVGLSCQWGIPSIMIPCNKKFRKKTLKFSTKNRNFSTKKSNKFKNAGLKLKSSHKQKKCYSLYPNTVTLQCYYSTSPRLWIPHWGWCCRGWCCIHTPVVSSYNSRLGDNKYVMGTIVNYQAHILFVSFAVSFEAQNHHAGITRTCWLYVRAQNRSISYECMYICGLNIERDNIRSGLLRAC